MTEAQVIQLAAGAMIMAAKLGAPMILSAMAVGLLVSLFQSVTQIQEMTLTFVPKVLVIALVLALTGHWMVSNFIGYVDQLFRTVPSLLAGG